MVTAFPLRHVFIVCHARTGGTWTGQLLNTCPNVKYLWEPNAPQHHRADQMPAWDVTDWLHVWCRVQLFKTHIPIRPTFPKQQMDTAVYKLHTVLGDMTRPAVKWTPAMFERIRKYLDAKVIHLVRHPTRWTASIIRWMPEYMNAQAHDLYAEANRAFHDRYHSEPWYRLYRHDDLVTTPGVIDGLFGFAELDQSEAFFQFQQQMHSKDVDHDDHDRNTIMTQRALLEKWRDMPEKWIDLAEETTDKHWSWAGYYPLQSKAVTP